MLSHHQIAAATRIGMLTRERDTVSACAQALAELCHALPLDMATLLSIDPLTGEHVQVAGIGYTAENSQAMAAEFVDTPWYRNVVRQDVPPSISEDADDPGQRFRHGWFYAERVRPAGLRDAMTGALRHDGRLVGLINLSTRTPDAYDTEARHLLASVIPALGALVDPTAHTGDLHGLPSEGAASLVAEGGIVGLPGRERARVAADEEFHPLLRAFAETGGRRLRLLWPLDGTWYRVSLHRHTTAPGLTGPASAVLVHETPTELPYGLSPRELEVLTRAAIGQTNQAIAQALFLSPRTVHSHIEHLLRKTGAASRAEATALAVRDGLLRPTPDHLGRFVERGGDSGAVDGHRALRKPRPSY
ncbi:LuxR C-terminal-related transcriptional regulator [Streptomyces sp. ME02-8801-2C]|uniref:LuxR C-terminal-related transcriptional regulator n=1 Tax=Streptomyces sp. ME02-8801-2C TaxID=3028680 RepID=UPI0029BC0DD7|nr:LuxR C-terminal-related transcriptional regulator [Streptomyces sp. ME02-8801-2C]MDX3456418.1 LuxR C-terminal-related transcriptional regulator [Streptomyces sp. ME02-8801-2C]